MSETHAHALPQREVVLETLATASRRQDLDPLALRLLELKALLGADLADVVAEAKSISLDDYQDAVRERGLLGSRMRQFMEGYDLLVTPTLPIPAFEAGKLAPSGKGETGKWLNWTPFSYPFNLTQQPAITVPCGLSSEGLPISLQLVGPMFDDALVLRAARAFESVCPVRRPAAAAA